MSAMSEHEPRRLFPTFRAALTGILDLFGQVARKGVPRSRLVSFDASVLARQLASLLRGSVPLPQALAFLSEEFFPRVAQRLVRVRNRVAAGEPLSAALEELPASWFPRSWRATVAAGERSGRLPESLDQLGEEGERMLVISRRLRGVLVYPLTVLGFASVITSIIIAKVVPVYASLFGTLGATLPFGTRIVIRAVDLLFPWAGLVVLAAIIVVLLSFTATSTGSPLHWLGKHAADLFPFSRRLRRSIVEIRFTRTLRLLLDAGVPLPEALDLCEEAVADSRTGLEIAAAARRIREGELPSQALEEVGAVSPAFLWFLAGTEHRGDFLEVTAAMAETAEERFIGRLEIAERVLEPAAILITGGLIGFLVFSFYAPLFRLSALIGN
jgi:general secretion pathway protein F